MFKHMKGYAEQRTERWWRGRVKFYRKNVKGYRLCRGPGNPPYGGLALDMGTLVMVSSRCDWGSALVSGIYPL